MEWADIVKQFAGGRAWADDDEQDRSWADVVAQNVAPESLANVVAPADDGIAPEQDRSWADVVAQNVAPESLADVVAPADDGIAPADNEPDESLSDVVAKDEPECGDPVGIRAIQKILMSATQTSLSHFHTAGMEGAVNADRPSAADAMNAVYSKTSMTFESSDDVYALRRQIVGASLSTFMRTVGCRLTVLPEKEHIWYEALGKKMYDGNILRIYVDYNKMADHGLTLSHLAHCTFCGPVRGNFSVSPDFMGMIDVHIPDAYMSSWLSVTNDNVVGTKNISSCEKITNVIAVTKGTDILAVCRVPTVNKRTIRSNHVLQVEKHFGIEAAASVLCELTGSCIVSDFMTRTGKVLSFMKNSVEVKKKGLLTSMGFERPKEDIKRANTGGTSVYEHIITGIHPHLSHELFT